MVQPLKFVWEWISYFIPFYARRDYLSMMGLKLIHVNKKRPWLNMIKQNQTVATYRAAMVLLYWCPVIIFYL